MCENQEDRRGILFDIRAGQIVLVAVWIASAILERRVAADPDPSCGFGAVLHNQLDPLSVQAVVAQRVHLGIEIRAGRDHRVDLGNEFKIPPGAVAHQRGRASFVVKRLDPNWKLLGIALNAQAMNDRVGKQKQFMLESNTPDLGTTRVSKGIQTGLIQCQVVSLVINTRIGPEKLDPCRMRGAIEKMECPHMLFAPVADIGQPPVRADLGKEASVAEVLRDKAAQPLRGHRGDLIKVEFCCVFHFFYFFSYRYFERFLRGDSHSALALEEEQ